MAKVLTKKVENKEVTRQVNPSLVAIERLTALNGTLVKQVKDLSMEVDNLKDRIAQVASRLGL